MFPGVKLSIVIPAYNEERLLPESLAAIHNATTGLTRRGWDYEVIVCDNNSSDATAKTAARSGAKVVFEAINQIGRARNTGAAAATGEWLLFIDADTHPSHRLLARTRSIMVSGRHLAGGAVINWETDVAWAKFGEKLWRGASISLAWAAGSYLFVRKDIFDKLGGFNHALYVSEELDLSIRLNRAARQQGLEPLHIIRDAPAETSDRKLHLYSGREFLTFFIRSILFRNRVFREPGECNIWYDGRR